MVLRPTNFANQVESENIPPSTFAHPKSLVSRLRDDGARQRSRTRPTGSSRTSKYLAKQARKRKETRKTTSVRFNVTPVPTIMDVEMEDLSRPKTIPIILPKLLQRPEYKEIPRETILAAEPSLDETDVQFLRDSIEAISPELMRSLGSVQVNPMRNSLPTELTVLVNEMTSVIPSHVLAVFGPPPPASSNDKPPAPRKVVLYPIHSLVLALHCANLPKPPPTLPAPDHQPGQQPTILPVWNICLPSPITYPQLSTYLYTKKIDHIVKSFLPAPPPSTLLQDPRQVLRFGGKLAATFTPQIITKHALAVHGLWSNVYALGIYDDNLWDAMDALWETLLTALAIATDNPGLMIPSSKSTTAESEASSSSS